MSTNRRLLAAAGLALIVLTNAVALGGVAWNRGGQPDSRLALSERELVLPWRSAGPDSENSGLSLDLRWNCLPAATPGRHGAGYVDSTAPAWLDARKMAELGFDLRAPELTRPLDRAPLRREQLPREVWVVLELDGPAYRQWLDDAAQSAAKEALASASKPPSATPLHPRDTSGDTRLFAVDAGLDRDALRVRHPDRAQYAIVRARVSPRLGSASVIDGGRIDALSIADVNVPLALRPVFDGLERQGWQPRPRRRFEATLVFGRRAEPWLADARRSPDGQ